MKKPQSKKIDYEIKNDQNFTFGNKNIRTTNINILLNRVRQENKSELKKNFFLTISLIAIVCLISIMVLVN